MDEKFHFVITAGPTREHLDPVRFLSNPSTGKMGFAIARAASLAGHKVTLVSGPVNLTTPKGVKRIDVISAREMLRAVESALFPQDKSTLEDRIFISTAAVADWRPKKCAKQKMKKGTMSGVIELVRNPDILKTISKKAKGSIRLVGFAAETNDVLKEAARKCEEKGLEFIVANDVTEKGCGFGTDTNRVTILKRDGSKIKFPLMSKAAVAKKIIQLFA